jgi:hypothetical protein
MLLPKYIKIFEVLCLEVSKYLQICFIKYLVRLCVFKIKITMKCDAQVSTHFELLQMTVRSLLGLLISVGFGEAGNRLTCPW